MTDTAKSVNYSKVQLESLITAYTAEELTDADRKDVMEKFAKEFGKTVNSIRSKLSREKVYIKPTKTTKAGGAITRKADIVATIAQMTDNDVETIASLEKATKLALEAIVNALVALSPDEDESKE